MRSVTWVLLAVCAAMTGAPTLAQETQEKYTPKQCAELLRLIEDAQASYDRNKDTSDGAQYRKQVEDLKKRYDAKCK